MITGVVLTHNNEHSVAETLDSLSWCDEILLVDDNSTDQTTEIAKGKGAKVYSHAVADDFAAQRNFGLQKAPDGWVLFVDSDEVISDELAEEIRRVTGLESGVEGYFIKRKDFLWERELRYGEVGRMQLLRLAKKDAGTWVRPVHEVWVIKGKTATLNNAIHHYPHPDVAQFLSDINHYSTLNAKHYYDSGVRANVFQIVGYPAAKFFINYVWRLGFLDGMPGAIVAFMMSFHSFLTRSKLYMLAHDHGDSSKIR